MAQILTSLELYVVVKELRQLTGAKVSKIHQPSSRVLTINLFKIGGKKFLLKIDSGVGMYVTSFSSENPLTPTSFCLFLRKHLNNSKLIDIKQKKLERVVELHFDTKAGLRILICELFSKGNFVLCDGAYKILNCAAVQQWKDRIIKKGENYKYPPESLNLLELSKQTFQNYLSKNKQREIVRLLATLGFGGTYAEELCLRANIRKNTIAQMLKLEEINLIYSEIQNLLSQFKSQSTPKIVYRDNTPFDAIPFDLNIYKNHEKKLAESFNQALDILYASEIARRIKEQSNAKYMLEKQRLETIYNSQKRNLDEYEHEYKKNQRIADTIYNQYQTISKIFSKIKQAVDSGYDWYEVYQVLQREKEQGIYEANLVKEIRAETRQIVIDLGDEVALDLTKSLEQNAGDYYEKAKKAKLKLEGAQRTLARVEQKLIELEANQEKMQQSLAEREPKLIEKKRREWYEKFHWFFTSSGLLAVGGRDATSNEIVIKKYMEIKDIVFHTDIAGSPFFLLKNARDKATEKDIKEVAQATASYSAAWKLGIAAADTYWVKPEQVSKRAQAGEYLGKGAFMVRGRRNRLSVELKLAVGVTKGGKIMGGPPTAIQKNCAICFIIAQGDKKKSDVAKEIQRKIREKQNLSLDLDEIIRVLPTGGSKIIS